MGNWESKLSDTLSAREKNKSQAVNNDIQPIYDFDKDVLDLTDLKISKTNIVTSTGFDYELESDLSKDDF